MNDEWKERPSMTASAYCIVHIESNPFSPCQHGMDQYFVSAAFLGLAIVFAVARFRIKPRHPLPPGPVPKLLTGNAHQLPTKEPWRTYADWAEKYGTLPLKGKLGKV